MSDLILECKRARSALTVASHLADQADEIRYMMPLGYGSEPSHDGIRRPTETLLSALDDRGVTDRVLRARRLLAAAATQIECAAQELDAAVKAWEGVRK